MSAREAAFLLVLTIFAILVGVIAGGYALTVAREREFLKDVLDEGP